MAPEALRFQCSLHSDAILLIKKKNTLKGHIFGYCFLFFKSIVITMKTVGIKNNILIMTSNFKVKAHLLSVKSPVVNSDSMMIIF